MIYSDYQVNIFNFVKNNIKNGSNTPHAICPAGPGSGKTTTIIEATKEIPPSMKCMVGSFNKHIADALQGRVAPHSSATLNSCGWKACLNYKRGIRLDAFKTRNTLQTFFNLNNPQEQVAFNKVVGSVSKLVDLFK